MDNVTAAPIIEMPDDNPGVGLDWVPYVTIFGCVALLVVVVYGVYRYRKKSRHEYTALRDVEDMPTTLMKHSKRARDVERDAALLMCSFYLRSSGQYLLIDHLPDIGCRPQKHWFLVKNVNDHTDKMLTMMPRAESMISPFTTATRQTLRELFSMLQHPYLQPIDEIDFQLDKEQVVMVQPFSGLGSLKDIIHGVRCVDSWDYKYCYPGTSLQMHNMQNYGRQILEGVKFLQKKGMPACSHLHSGNVLVQKDVCRIGGYENSLLGFNNRMTNFLRKPLRKDMTACDTLCFGHLLYELATGRLLDATYPTAEHYKSIAEEPTQEILQFIFDDRENIPDIDQLIRHEYFRHVSLPDIDIPKVKKTPEVKALLKAIKRSNQGRSKSKRESVIEREAVELVDPATRDAFGSVDTADVFSTTTSSSKPKSEVKSSTATDSSTRDKARPPSADASSTGKTKPSKGKKPKVSRKPSTTEDLPKEQPPKVTNPERSAFLSEIQQGVKLKRSTSTIDPKV